jgi:hypothetical protein
MVVFMGVLQYRVNVESQRPVAFSTVKRRTLVSRRVPSFLTPAVVDLDRCQIAGGSELRQ